MILVWRDIRRAWASGGVLWPIAFFLLATILFPFAIGPDSRLLARVGGGVVWAAALLAALLPVERLVAPDLEAGVLDQLAVRGQSLDAVAALKMAAHWLAFAPPLMLAAVVAAGLLGMSGDALARVELGLLLGTPGLAALAVATGALVAGLRGAGGAGRAGDAAAGGAAADLRRGYARSAERCWRVAAARGGQPAAGGRRAVRGGRGAQGGDGVNKPLSYTPECAYSADPPLFDHTTNSPPAGSRNACLIV